MNTASTHSGVIRTGPYPELTWAAILVGYFLGTLIAISIGYAALILGFSIEGSELAAILGFGILKNNCMINLGLEIRNRNIFIPI